LGWPFCCFWPYLAKEPNKVPNKFQTYQLKKWMKPSSLFLGVQTMFETPSPRRLCCSDRMTGLFVPGLSTKSINDFPGDVQRINRMDRLRYLNRFLNTDMICLDQSQHDFQAPDH
jgi:hypothetical protein